VPLCRVLVVDGEHPELPSVPATAETSWRRLEGSSFRKSPTTPSLPMSHRDAASLAQTTDPETLVVLKE
jgi:hypothetical protein